MTTLLRNQNHLGVIPKYNVNAPAKDKVLSFWNIFSTALFQMRNVDAALQALRQESFAFGRKRP